MALKNTTLTYGSLAKWLHWSIALLFLSAYGAIYFRIWLTDDCPVSLLISGGCSEANLTSFMLHRALGLTIAAFVLLRIIYRLSNQQPKPEPASPMAHRAASAMHYVLYFFMIAMPLSGWLGTGGTNSMFGLFDVISFKNSETLQWLLAEGYLSSYEALEIPMDFFHKRVGGALMVWILVILHASAAIYHHVIVKDRTLVRILPERSKSS